MVNSTTDWPRIQREVAERDHEALREQNRLRRSQDPRPNLLLIVTDQQSAQAMSGVGNPWAHTPHMDALARRGVSFRRSYCAAPVCGPARASLITGCPPEETGVRYNGQTPAAHIPTVGESLRAAGYETTYCGKWHLPESYVATHDGIRGYHNLPLPDDLEWSHLGSVADMQVAAKANRYLRWHAGLSDKPWHLVVSFHNPHDICYQAAPPDHWLAMPEPLPEACRTAQLPPLPPNFDIDPLEPDLLQERRAQSRYCGEVSQTANWSREQWRCYLQVYYHLVQQVDRCLGVVLSGLQAGGWMDNTVILFTSDHGEGMAAHQWITKLSLYEEVLRVPLILVSPDGQGKGKRDDTHLVSGLDVVPTLLDYAGVPREGPPSGRTGSSLRPLLHASPGDWRFELNIGVALDPDRPVDRGLARIRADGMKLVEWSRGKRSRQRFNLLEDPGETLNGVVIS